MAVIKYRIWFTIVVIIPVHMTVHHMMSCDYQIDNMIISVLDETKYKTLMIEDSKEIMLVTVILLIVLSSQSIASIPDWLITEIPAKTNLTKTPKGTLLLSNTLISREFSVIPEFTTIDYYSYEKQSSILRATSPEAVIQIDGLFYNVGHIINNMPHAYMNRTALTLNFTSDANGFQFVNYSTQNPIAPFSYKPRRGAPKNIVWPPKGLRLDVNFKAPSGASDFHKEIQVTVHYEMYDGIPLMSKWVSIAPSPSVYGKCTGGVVSVEYLAVNNQWGSATWGEPVIENYHFYEGDAWLYVETDQSHGTQAMWQVGPDVDNMPGSFEPIMNATFISVPNIPLQTDGFESFRVHELAIGSLDQERRGLAKHRMMRLLAPQTQENPIFFHMTNSSSASVRGVIDQLAEVGFEMMIYSFGSGFDIESTNRTYLDQMKADIAYANSKGIEVGGYDLICWSRSVKAEWMAINISGEPHGSACFASGWYDFLLERFVDFIDYTGLSMVETDGPYPGYNCSSKNHSHHKDITDSVYYQQQLQGKFFHELRKREIYINQPDYFFYQGGSRTVLGYSEKQFSLPRWQDISISRQGVFDHTFKLMPTAGWMFVPLIVYEAGGDPAKFEPLAEHLTEYEWALAQYLGAGVAACYRGYRVYDTPETKAVVTKWVSFYKKYREILTSDIVHVRRPDMQSIDCFMHVNPFLKSRALAMVFNPTDMKLSTKLHLPLYYTGLTTYAHVSQEGGQDSKYKLARDYTINVKVTLAAKGITWFLVQ